MCLRCCWSSPLLRSIIKSMGTKYHNSGLPWDCSWIWPLSSTCTTQHLLSSEETQGFCRCECYRKWRSRKSFPFPYISVTQPDGQSISGSFKDETPIENQMIFSVSNAQLPPTQSKEQKEESNVIRAFQLISKHAYHSYSDLWVIRWSIWWATTTAGFLQVYGFIQILWQEIQDDEEMKGKQVLIYNGSIEATQNVLGALATLGCGWLRLNWKFVGEFSLATVAVIQGLVTILSALTKDLWVAYLCYIIFGIFHQAMVTISSMEVAKKIEDDCYGLIFGLNTFMALLIQTIWTIVAISDVGFALGGCDQFHRIAVWRVMSILICSIHGEVKSVQRILAVKPNVK